MKLEYVTEELQENHHHEHEDVVPTNNSPVAQSVERVTVNH